MSNILCSIPICELGSNIDVEIKSKSLKKQINEDEDKDNKPPILCLPCEHEGDTPYFYAYEISYNNKHYVFVKRVSMIDIANGKHIDVIGYKYYCPEEDTYKIFDNTNEMKRYYKFIIYKYFE